MLVLGLELGSGSWLGLGLEVETQDKARESAASQGG